MAFSVVLLVSIVTIVCRAQEPPTKDQPDIKPTDLPGPRVTGEPDFKPTDLPKVPMEPELCNMDKERNVTLHEYWISREGEKDQDKDGKEITLDGDKVVELNRCDKAKNPRVSQRMYDACIKQMTCRLEDGSLYELIQENGQDCFSQLDTTQYPWGFGWVPYALYTSVIARGHKVGTTLMVNQLIDVLLPNATKKHNGCVRVDDTFLAKDDNDLCDIHIHIGYYSMLKSDLFAWPDRVTITEAKCDILKYD